MKTIDIENASGTLAEYLKQAQTEPLVLTDHGTPTAVILTLVNTDLETAALSTNPEFIALIERSRARANVEGELSTAEMRRAEVVSVRFATIEWRGNGDVASGGQF